MNSGPTFPEDVATEELTPLYRQIRRALREEILSGVRRAGDRLPSEAELAEAYGTTRTTVRQALSQLVFEGLIAQHSGRGSFVCERRQIRSAIDSRRCMTFEEQVALSGRSVTYGACTFAQIEAPVEIAARLRIEPMSEIFFMDRVRMIEGRPACVEQRYLPHEIGLRVTGAMLARVAAHRFVSDILGIEVPTIVVSITATAANAELARQLDVVTGFALVVRENVHLTADAQPVLCGRSLLRGDICTDYVLGKPLPAAASDATEVAE